MIKKTCFFLVCSIFVCCFLGLGSFGYKWIVQPVFSVYTTYVEPTNLGGGAMFQEKTGHILVQEQSTATKKEIAGSEQQVQQVQQIVLMSEQKETVGSEPQVQQVVLMSEQKEITAQPITIWVHGTKINEIFPKPISSINNPILDKFMHCPPGLHHVQDLDPKYYHFTIGKTLYESDPERFPLDKLYFFGWSGLLCPKERFKAAKDLQQGLEKIMADYEARYKKRPRLFFITHSHGGNVVLDWASLFDEQEKNLPEVELLLLACPVQKETERYIHHPLFKKIYSLHSHIDLVQIADPQGWPELKEQLKNVFNHSIAKTVNAVLKQLQEKPLFSERHFEPDPKLLQIKVQVNKKGLLHVQFMLADFVKLIPTILAHIAQEQYKKCKRGPDVIMQLTTQKTKKVITNIT